MSTLIINKKASFDYQLLDKFEAGLVLSGAEVKAIRAKEASLKSSYVTLNRQRELYLTNATISLYKKAGPQPNYQPTRPRKLLLHKKEIDFIAGQLQQAGLTLIPLSLYTKHKKIKLEIALAKGKRQIDKRQDIKKREQKRQISDLMKQRLHRG